MPQDVREQIDQAVATIRGLSQIDLPRQLPPLDRLTTLADRFLGQAPVDLPREGEEFACSPGVGGGEEPADRAPASASGENFGPSRLPGNAAPSESKRTGHGG